jgi:hypothetical protein
MGNCLMRTPDLEARFPVLHEFQSYKVTQGAVLAAAVDNNLGPLSTLPPNVTRRSR